MKHKLNSCDSPSLFKLRRLDNSSATVHHKSNCVNSLLDLSAKVVAAFLPFEYVEKMLVHIPEPVQEKIIYYSFPQRDSDIYTYASFHSKGDKSRDKIPYYQGLEYFQNDCVEDVIQIGFHLTGSVRSQLNSCVPSDNDSRKFEVSITFDRCKIISVCCDCGNKGLSWCPHVVALALFRIRQPHLVDYRSPISDALIRMDRSQLQKFAQYLIASHPNKILPSAQQLADQLLQPESNINKTSGAPDPTAGGSLEDVAAWYLDEAGVREQLRTELANLANIGTVPGSFGSTMSVRSTNRSASPNLTSSGTLTYSGPSTTSVHTTRPNTGPRRSDVEGHLSESHSNQDLNSDRNNPNTSLEIGLDWLLRYRRLTINHNLLLGTPASFYSSLSSLDLATPSSQNADPSGTAGSNTAGGHGSTTVNPDQHHHNPNMNQFDYFSQSPMLSSSMEPDWCTGHHHHHHHNNHQHHGSVNTSGSQIAAMFAKVRELLAKHDTNGPRLLSLITEELLSCSKLPLLKARRSQRTTTNLDTAPRLQYPGLTRSSSSQHLGSHNFSNEPNNLFSNSSLSGSFTQPPPWTVRLWEEVCLLWTCVVLSPDCSVEARRQWRNRFLTWARASRCPRDESYSIPPHYFASIHDPTEAEDDSTLPGSQSQQSHPTNGRPNRRISVFQLPIEVSFMSWDDLWLRHLLSPDDSKSDKQDDRDDFSRMNSSFTSTEDNSEANRLFRRPSSMTPKRSMGFSRPAHPCTPRECQCPYCDHSAPLNEPFPLLCLRVAALRSNGYLSQALHLAVFISQRLLRSVKTKTSVATNAILASTSRSPPQVYPSNASWSGAHSNDMVARRMLFGGNGQGIRIASMNPTGMPYSPGRYPPNTSMPPSPSLLPNHVIKYGPSSRLPSPRPSSLSPPIPLNHSRSVSRRRGLSPSSNPSPGPVGSNPNSNWATHNSCPPLPPPQPYLLKSPPPSHPFPNQTYPFSSHPPCPASSSPVSPSTPPFHHPLYQSPPQQTGSFPYHKPYYNSNTPYPFCSSAPVNGPPHSPGLMHHPHNRNLSSPTLPNRTPTGARSNLMMMSGHTSPHFQDYGTADAFPLNHSSCFSCPSHTHESGWIGLPGRPLVCLIECLLDAAAIVVETANHHQTPSSLPSWGQMEKASFYLCLSVKVSMLALFQQRRMVNSLSRLISCQNQEARLLALLNTVPKDPTTALAMCDTLSQLLGPPLSSRILARMDHQLLLNSWWWSALGPAVHPDSYPIHAVAEFALDYLLETQRQNQLTSFNTCWTYPGSISSVRIDDMAFTLVTRAMRFSIMEAPSDQISNPIDSNSNPNPGSGYSNCRSSERPTFTHRHWDFSHTHQPNSDVSLAVNIEVVGDGSETLTTSSSSIPIPSTHNSTTNNNNLPDNHPNYPSHPIPSPTHLRWTDPMESDRLFGFPNCPSVPPLPSAFVAAAQACLKVGHNHPLSNSNYNSTLLPISSPIPSFIQPMFPNFDSRHGPSSSSTTTTTATTPATPTNYNYTSRFSSMDDNQYSNPSNSSSANHVSIHTQNPQFRRCMDSLKLRQIRLAVALIRVSKSNIHRLDQIVQICDQYIHSAVSLLDVSQQVFAEAVGWKLGSSNRKIDTFGPSNFTGFHNPNSPLSMNNPSLEAILTRDRINLICTAFHLALNVVLRTLTRSVHWRRREMLAWAVSVALHVGPSACFYLVNHWASYVNAREAVSWLAPALLTALGTLDSTMSSLSRSSKSVPSKLCSVNGNLNSTSNNHHLGMDQSLCFGHSSLLLFGLPNWDSSSSSVLEMGHPTLDGSQNPTGWPSWWYGFYPTAFASRNHTNSITMAAQLIGTTIPFSKTSREHIVNAVRHMAMQAAAKDPVNCALPALSLSEKDSASFDAVYRLVLHAAESGSLGPIQLFSLAHYMDNRGWTWRAFPFALHATRLFALSATQESHPMANEVLWACLLAHRLGPGALQEILNHVIRNVHCPTLLTDILHRCRSAPSGLAMMSNPNGNPNLPMDSEQSGNVNTMNMPASTRNQCLNNMCNLQAHHHPNGNPIPPPPLPPGAAPSKLLSLDRPPLKGLLDAAINAFVFATHTRLNNISPRQYAEFVDFLARARETFHLLRPDGPAQFRSLVECLRQTYRGKRKLVALLAERFD